MITIQDLYLVIWVLLWMIGGMLIVVNIYEQTTEVVILLGLSVGFIIETWLANILSQFLIPNISFWLSPLVVFLAGILIEYKHKKIYELRKDFKRIFLLGIGFALSILLFYLINQGLPIFDEFQNLPTISRLAAGDIPPHFPLNPELPFGYHYFQLLFISQVSLIGNIFPSIASDLVHSFTLTLTVALTSLYVYQFTKSKLAQYMSVVFVLLSSGARWLLYLLPTNMQDAMNRQITLIGSGGDSGRNLIHALSNNWAIENGHFPFPFVYASGINQPLFLALGGIGASGLLIILTIALTRNSGSRLHLLLIPIFISSLALASEVWFAFLGFGILFTLLSSLFVKDKEFKRQILLFSIAALIGLIVAALQGGMITELRKQLIGILTDNPIVTYYSTSINWTLPPVIVSSHLGKLEITNTYHLLAIFVEIGTVVFAIPFMILFYIRNSMGKDHVMSILGFGYILSLCSIFFVYEGSGGISGTTRLYEIIIYLSTIFGFPIVWTWVIQKSNLMKLLFFGLFVVGIFSGAGLFSISLQNIPYPTYAKFIDPIDVNMYKAHWNKLPSDALVFDTIPIRAVTILGRATNTNISWFEETPKWENLHESLSPTIISKEGFDYVYIDTKTWQEMVPSTIEIYKDGCPILVDKQKQGFEIRRLYDIRGCKQ